MNEKKRQQQSHLNPRQQTEKEMSAEELIAAIKSLLYFSTVLNAQQVLKLKNMLKQLRVKNNHIPAKVLRAMQQKYEAIHSS